MEASEGSLLRGATASQVGWALWLWLLLSASGASKISQPSLTQPEPSVLSGQGNPQILCVVRGSSARAHVLSWYRQLPGSGPTFLLSQREGASPTYGVGVNPRFLAEMDVARNAVRLTVGNAGPADEGIYYCAVWFSGQYIFGEGTRLLYQAEMHSPAPQPPQLSLFIPASGPPFQALCVAHGQHPAPLRVSWVLRGQEQEEEDFTGRAGEPVVSWLQLPPEAAGMPLSCRGLHQSGALEAALVLPGGQGCGSLGPDSCEEILESHGDILLEELEETLTVVTYCYLGLLGAAQGYSLLLAALWKSRCWRARPREFSSAPRGIRVQPRPRGEQPSASICQVLRGATPPPS